MRRADFVVSTFALGSSFALGFKPAAAALAHTEVTPWVVIDPDNTITIRIAQSEFGQGVLTSNAMIVAEELACDWAKVRVEFADPNRSLRENKLYGRMETDSSASFRLGREPLQQAGASARERLKLAAAVQFDVPVEDLTVKNGWVIHPATDRRLSYGQLAQKAAGIKLAKEPAVKTPDQYTLIGKRVRRLDAPAKVSGKAIYSIDVRLPGMVYAAVAAAPTFGGKLKSYDFSAVRRMTGIHSVVPLKSIPLPLQGTVTPEAVAIVADTWWHAKRAVDALPVQWEDGPNATVSSPDLFRQFEQLLDQPGARVLDVGDVDRALDSAKHTVEGTYHLPHQTHGTMEPLNCTAQVTPGRVDIWCGEQAPDYLLTSTAKQLGIAPENVYVHNHLIGGAYGGRFTRGDAAMAVAIAQTLNGKPVKLILAREQDFRVDQYHPMGVSRFKAVLRDDGMPAAVSLRVVGNHYPFGEGPVGAAKVVTDPQTAVGFTELPYAIPNLRIELTTPITCVPSSSWRGSGAVNHSFHQECFIDELAVAAGKDPLRYRRALIEANHDFLEGEVGGGAVNRAAWLTVLDTVATASNWGSPLPPGSGRGVAIDDRRVPSHRGTTVTAVVVAATVSRSGIVKVDRVDVAMDTGYTLCNPLTVENQINGQVFWYLTAALKQKISIDRGRLVQRNFDAYPHLRMADTPKIGIHFVQTQKWNAGIGDEVIMIAPALCNAIYAATGKRIRSLPIADHDLRWA